MRKFIHLGILTSLGLVISLFESSIGFQIMVPGAKIGLSNIILLSVLLVYSYKEALFVGILKSLLLVLITGQVSSMIYSLVAGLVSILVMQVSLRYLGSYLSLIGVSILGSIAHNVTQVGLAAYILGSKNIYTILPYLIIIALITGAAVGLASSYLYRHLKKIGQVTRYECAKKTWE